MTLNFDAINRAAWEHIEGLAREIDPGARREGPEWCINASWRGEKGRNSLKANVEKRIINDFADRGYDPIKLWATHRGISNGEAAAELAERFHVGGTEDFPKWDGPKPGLVWVPMHEAPELPYQAPAGRPSKVWTYLDASGRPLFQRPRYDFPDGKKAVIWWTVYRQADGTMEWTKAAPPSPLPLYGLDRLQDATRDFVLVAEGEKAADAGQALFPRAAAVTSGSCSSAPTADWTPLRGRQVILWPDHDEPGVDYAGAVAAQLKAQGVSLRVVEVPAHFPPGWDLADPCPPGVLPSDLQRMIDEAQPWEGKEDAPPHALDLLRWSDLKDRDVPPVQYIWEPFLTRVAFGIIAAHPGTGKSFLALQLAVSVATGLPLFGHPTCGPAGAGLVALEDDPTVVHRRLKAIRRGYGSMWTPKHDDLMETNLRILVRARRPLEALNGAAAAHQLAAMAQEIGAHMQTTRDPVIIFLDTLNAIHDGEENSNTEARVLNAAILGLSDTLGGCSIYALHHLRKAGNGKNAPMIADRLDPELVRGAGAFVGSARAVVQFGWIQPQEAGKVGLEQENSHRRYAIVALTKVNDGPLSSWLLLEHSPEFAGIFVPVPKGDEVLAALRGGNAEEDLSLAETMLLDIHRDAGLTDKEIRKTLLAKYYPDDPKADSKLKGMLTNLRHRKGWLVKGGLKLTVPGFQKVQELGQQSGEAVNSDDSNDESWRASA